MRYNILGFLLLCSCSTTYPNQKVSGRDLMPFSGTALSGQAWRFPDDLSGQPALLLVGYEQRTQFDIDRWLIGLDMTQTRVNIFEVPAIQGVFPRLFSSVIDRGMRSGIPEELWKVVVTVYEDGEALQKFTGNERGLNARVMLVDGQGKVRFFHDRGFSVAALNKLRQVLDQLPAKS